MSARCPLCECVPAERGDFRPHVPVASRRAFRIECGDLGDDYFPTEPLVKYAFCEPHVTEVQRLVTVAMRHKAESHFIVWLIGHNIVDGGKQ